MLPSHPQDPQLNIFKVLADFQTQDRAGKCLGVGVNTKNMSTKRVLGLLGTRPELGCDSCFCATNMEVSCSTTVPQYNRGRIIIYCHCTRICWTKLQNAFGYLAMRPDTESDCDSTAVRTDVAVYSAASVTSGDR